MPENFGADANAHFPPPWLWAWLNLHARETLLKRIFDVFLLGYYLEFYIRLQRESSNEGD